MTLHHRVRVRRNPRSYTDSQKSQMAEADKVVVRARIYELGVSEFLKEDCGLDGAAVSIAESILRTASLLRKESEDIYQRVRDEADEAARESKEKVLTQ